MTRRTVHFRFVWPIAILSLGLIALCCVMAAFLLRQQSGIADMMGENIQSARAAADLEESLVDLIALLKDHVEGVATLHERLDRHLKRIHQLADHDEEWQLAARLTSSFRSYLDLWLLVPPRPGPAHERAVRKALLHLESDTLRICQELRNYNNDRIEQGAEDHRRILRELAWGMAGVGCTGGFAGLFLGYLAARAVQRSIQRLQVQIRDAAGKLPQEVPEVVLTADGDLDGLQGQLQGLVSQVEEVVARLQQREREVRRAEQLAAVGQLAAGVAHEIRNPLTSIKMLVQLAREDGAAGLSAEDLPVVEREVRRMEKSLDTFLAFARPSTPQRRDQDLVEVARHTLGLVRGRAERQKVSVELITPDAPLIASVDGEQIHQVLVNLCLNAFDAMPTGGKLQLVLSDGDGLMEIKVLDSGSGIPPALLPRLFQPFFSTKDTGLGLGLVISRRIVEDHGGTLVATNRPEGGACLTLQLPLAKATDVRSEECSGPIGIRH